MACRCRDSYPTPGSTFGLGPRLGGPVGVWLSLALENEVKTKDDTNSRKW